MSYVILLLCALPAVLANSTGPPVATSPNLCTDMIPTGHNGGTSMAADQANPPYSIITSASEYSAGDTITVTITGLNSNQFKGFFIQARRADPARDNDVAIGTFSSPPANTQLLECHGVTDSAWGHSNNMDRSSVVGTWTAPAQDEGPVEFMATIVKGVPDRSYFYTGVKSAQISSAGSTGTAPDETATSAESNTNAASASTGAANEGTTQAGPTSGAANEGTTQAGPTSGGSVHRVSFVLACLVVMLAAVLAVRQN